MSTISAGKVQVDNLTVQGLGAGAIQATNLKFNNLDVSGNLTLQGAPVATQAFVSSAVSGVIGSAGAALDTLGEIQAALGNDANLASTLTNSIATKANASDVTAGLALKANAADLTSGLALKANLAAPSFTGTVTAPTLSVTGNETVTGTLSVTGGSYAAAPSLPDITRRTVKASNRNGFSILLLSCINASYDSSNNVYDESGNLVVTPNDFLQNPTTYYSDIRYNPAFVRKVWATIGTEDTDLKIFCGDLIYTDFYYKNPGDTWAIDPWWDQSGNIINNNLYTKSVENYALMKKIMENDIRQSGFPNLLKGNNFIGIWDDHDAPGTRVNNAGSVPLAFKNYCKGLYSDIFNLYNKPTRKVPQAIVSDVSGNVDKGLWGSYTYTYTSFIGSNTFKVKVIMLDNNWNYNKDAGFWLSDAQRNFYINEIKDAKDNNFSWTLVVTPSPISAGSGDTAVLRPDTDILFKAINDNALERVFFLTGDLHYSEITLFSPSGGNWIKTAEIMSSGLAGVSANATTGASMMRIDIDQLNQNIIVTRIFVSPSLTPVVTRVPHATIPFSHFEASDYRKSLAPISYRYVPNLPSIHCTSLGPLPVSATITAINGSSITPVNMVSFNAKGLSQLNAQMGTIGFQPPASLNLDFLPDASGNIYTSTVKTIDITVTYDGGSTSSKQLSININGGDVWIDTTGYEIDTVIRSLPQVSSFAASTFNANTYTSTVSRLDQWKKVDTLASTYPSYFGSVPVINGGIKDLSGNRIDASGGSIDLQNFYTIFATDSSGLKLDGWLNQWYAGVFDLSSLNLSLANNIHKVFIKLNTLYDDAANLNIQGYSDLLMVFGINASGRNPAVYPSPSAYTNSTLSIKQGYGFNTAGYFRNLYPVLSDSSGNFNTALWASPVFTQYGYSINNGYTNVDKKFKQSGNYVVQGYGILIDLDKKMCYGMWNYMDSTNGDKWIPFSSCEYPDTLVNKVYLSISQRLLCTDGITIYAQ